MLIEKALGRNEVRLFFLVVSLLYVYPIIKSDYAYVDDSWRSLLLAKDDWSEQGRILLEVLYKILTFTDDSVNIFPMPLLISMVAIAMAMTGLTLRYFPKPDILNCLVFLPILCNPFFLGNLTYQYDGPGMVLAVVALIYAIICSVDSLLWRGFIAAVLVAVSLSLYQLAVSVFVGLCLLEYVWNIRNKVTVAYALSLLVQRGVQLLGGGLIYFLTTYQLVTSKRGKSTFSDNDWIGLLTNKFGRAMSEVWLLINPGNKLFVGFMLAVAAVGFCVLLKNILSMKGHWAGKALVAFIYLWIAPVLMVCVPGAMLLVREEYLQARNFIGFSMVLVFLFLLNCEIFERIGCRLKFFLIVPTLFMFSFCYAYGQILISKKELETAMAQYIAYDIVSKPELSDVDKFYFIGPNTGGNWLPRGHGAMTYMPVLRYILSSSSVLLHAEFFPRMGINNVVEGDRSAFYSAISKDKKHARVVDSKFYAIYVTEGCGFIVMKEILDSENYIEQMKLPSAAIDQ